MDNKYEYADRVTKRVIDKGKEKVEKRYNALEHLKITYVDPSKLKPNSYNPNKQSEHDFELLMRSMKEDGFTQPIIVQKTTLEIVDGEHRWRVSQALGYEEVPVVYVDMTPEQMRIATLRHNRARGSEEMELSAQVLKELQDLGALEWAQSSLMLSDEELSRLMSEADAAATLAAEEFSQAWDPAKIGSDITEQFKDAETAQRGVKLGMDGMITAATPAAAQARYEAEEELRREKDPIRREEKRIQIEEATYRVQLLFKSDEAEIVKTVLGDYPAVKLLELCRAEYEAQMQADMEAQLSGGMMATAPADATQAERRERKKQRSQGG